jgi:hypothetical protein
VELCSFELNDKPLSRFIVGLAAYDAFSGLGSSVNNKAAVCSASAGPIPPGQYYIIDRRSGGIKHRLRKFFNVSDDKDGWFALYAADGRIDDATFCDGVERGLFRLHPKGRLGISLGCIVINHPAEFDHVAAKLRGGSQMLIPGLDINAYGIVTVK